MHGVDVEGKQLGIDEELVELLGASSPLPVTYAGGVRSLVGSSTRIQGLHVVDRQPRMQGLASPRQQAARPCCGANRQLLCTAARHHILKLPAGGGGHALGTVMQGGTFVAVH